MLSCEKHVEKVAFLSNILYNEYCDKEEKRYLSGRNTDEEKNDGRFGCARKKSLVPR